MNTAYVSAATSLVTEGENGPFASLCKAIRLTETQQALSIPPHVVALAGLSCADPNLFARLQQEVHQDHHDQRNNNTKNKTITSDDNNKKNRMYQFSPSMLPTDPQIAKRMHAACRQRQGDLEAQAAKAGRKLLQQQQQSTTRKEKKQTKNKKHLLPPSSRATTTTTTNAQTEEEETIDTDEEDSSGDDQTETNDAAEIVSDPPQLSRRQVGEDDNDTEEAAWTHVAPRGNPAVATTAEKHIDPTVWTSETMPEEAVQEQEEEMVLAPRSASADDKMASVLLETSRQVEMSDTSCSISRRKDQQKDNASDSSDKDAELQRLREQVQHLESKLKETTTTLERERLTNSTGMQALQLRLYISETRLRTLEEALEHHVATVQNNCAMMPVSPERRKMHGDEDAHVSHHASQPRYSRILGQTTTTTLAGT